MRGATDRRLHRSMRLFAGLVRLLLPAPEPLAWRIVFLVLSIPLAAVATGLRLAPPATKPG